MTIKYTTELCTVIVSPGKTMPPSLFMAHLPTVAVSDLLKQEVSTQKYPFDENLDHIIGQLLANLGAPHLFTREVDFVATLILKHVSAEGS